MGWKGGTLKKSAVFTETSSGSSDFFRRPSLTSSSRLIIRVLPHSASKPEYGDQYTSSGGHSGRTWHSQDFMRTEDTPTAYSVGGSVTI